jgi:hypothetical protein
VAARLTGKTVAHGCARCPVEMGAAPSVDSVLSVAVRRRRTLPTSRRHGRVFGEPSSGIPVFTSARGDRRLRIRFDKMPAIALGPPSQGHLQRATIGGLAPMKEATHYSFVSGQQNIVLTLWPTDTSASPLYLTLGTQRAYELASHLKRLAELLENASA